MSSHLTCLGWTLIHSLWQAAIIALIYKALDVICSRTHIQVRYLLALVSLLSTLAAASVTLLYEETSVHLAAGSAPLSARTPVLFLQTVLTHALTWIDVLWMLGVLALSIRTAGGWWLVQRLRTTTIMQVPEAVVVQFQRLSQCLRVDRQVDLGVSAYISSPLTVGFVRSLVLLPVSVLTALTPEQVEVVLAHELAHIRRADYLWNFLQTVVETLFFFHPAVGWLGRRLREQRELCCDDTALEFCVDPVVYASALLCLEEQREAEPQLAMALGGHRSGSSLRSRISRVLGEPHRYSSTSRHALGFVSLLAVSGALLVLLLPPPQAYAHIRPFTVRQIVRHFRAATYDRHPAVAWVRPPKGIRRQTTSARMMRNASATWPLVKPHPPLNLHPSPRPDLFQRHDPDTVPRSGKSKTVLDIQREQESALRSLPELSGSSPKSHCGQGKSTAEGVPATSFISLKQLT